MMHVRTWTLCTLLVLSYLVASCWGEAAPGGATPTGNPGDATPTGAHGNATPTGAHGEATPPGSRGDATPTGSPGDATPATFHASTLDTGLGPGQLHGAAGADDEAAGLKLPTLEAATTLAEAAVVAAGHDRHVARLLAEVSSSTVDGALLLPPNGNNFFGASYAPANCSNNKPCGNTGNGPMGVQVADGVTEFGYKYSSFREVDITTSGTITVTYIDKGATYWADVRITLSSAALCNSNSTLSINSFPAGSAPTPTYASNTITINVPSISSTSNGDTWQASFNAVLCNQTCFDAPVMPGADATSCTQQLPMLPSGRCSLMCLQGYSPQGQPSATCKGDGNWTLTGACIPVCSREPALLNANTTSCIRPVQPGGSCNLTCLSGYSPQGQLSAACDRGDGDWTLTGACLPIVCSRAPEMPGANPESCIRPVQPGGSCSLTCLSGYGVQLHLALQAAPAATSVTTFH